MENNTLKTNLKTRPVIGTWSIMNSPILCDILAKSGMDFVILDGEHGPLDYESMQTCSMALYGNNVSSIIRVSGVVESEILKAIEIGADGIQIPNIKTVKDAKKAVEYSYFPPLGKRGFSPFTRGNGYALGDVKLMQESKNSNLLLIIHIEGKEGIKNIDAILEIKEIDVIFLGLYDISSYLGIPGDVNNKKVLDIFLSLLKKIKEKNKFCGTIITDDKNIDTFIDYGVDYLTFSVDCSVIGKRYIELSEKFKNKIRR